MLNTIKVSKIIHQNHLLSHINYYQEDTYILETSMNSKAEIINKPLFCNNCAWHYETMNNNSILYSARIWMSSPDYAFSLLLLIAPHIHCREEHPVHFSLLITQYNIYRPVRTCFILKLLLLFVVTKSFIYSQRYLTFSNESERVPYKLMSC